MFNMGVLFLGFLMAGLAFSVLVNVLYDDEVNSLGIFALVGACILFAGAI